MAETQQPMSSNDAGNVTGSSSKVQRVRGVLDAQGVNPKINQDNELSTNCPKIESMTC
jgi:hypothetical protein